MDYLNWTLSSRKLFKLQRKIQETEKKNPRLCRNFQRLLYRKSELQLLIINKILQIQFKRSTYKKRMSEPKTIQEKIIFSKLVSKEYRYFLTRQILNILWVFALSPILEKKKNDQIILTGLESSQIYKIICTFLQKPLIKYIYISQFSNFFNKKNKFWILSNLLIEKKFFLHWLKNEKLYRLSNAGQKWQFKYVCYEKTKILSLKTTFENFTNLNFINFYMPQVIKFNKQIQKSFGSRCDLPALQRKRSWQPAFEGARPPLATTSRTRAPQGLPVPQGGGLPPAQAPYGLVACGSLRSPQGTLKGPLDKWVSLAAGEVFTEFSHSLNNDKKMSVRKFRNKAFLLNRKKSFVKVYSPEASLINSQKLLLIKLNQRIVLRKVALNGIRPIFFSTDKTIQFKKYQTRLQKNNRKLNNLAYRMFQFTEMIESMKYSSKVIRIKTNSKQLHPLSPSISADAPNSPPAEGEPIHIHMGPSSAASSVFRFNETDLYKIFFQYIITFNFTHYCYFKKFCLKRQIYFQKYMNKFSFRFKFSNECLLRNPFQNDWMEYSGFLLLPLTTKINILHTFFNYYAQMHGLHLKFIKLYSLYQGIHFLGWFFQKKVDNLTGSISYANIQNHQKELKFYLKMSTNQNKPIDHIISELNKKILYWQKFYNCSIKLSKTCSQMNDYLFWLIWYWLKKRHRTRGSKWLYNHYWKKSTYRKWVFSDQNHTLIFYNL